VSRFEEDRWPLLRTNHQYTRDSKGLGCLEGRFMALMAASEPEYGSFGSGPLGDLNDSKVVS
jgi:hypothetical protein